MSKRFSLIVLLSIAIIYSIIIILSWGENYIDFGDGNYIYIAKRMADGLTLYKDILAPQPPIHLYTGKFLCHLGNLFGINSILIPFRFFSLCLHIFTFFLIYFIAKKIFVSEASALISAGIYMLIPIGFWWTRGYQSEPLEVFFLLFAFYFFSDFTKKSLIISAIFSTLAVFTNMTAVPYVLFNLLYLLIRKRKLFVYYFLPFFVLTLIIVFYFELKTGRYLENVFVNQVGSYPKKEMYPAGPIAYAVSKIFKEGKDIIFWEGSYIIFSLLGLIGYFEKFKDRQEKEYVGLYTFFALGSFIFVTKGATMEYIFTIGEPWVALFAGLFFQQYIKNNITFKKSDFISFKDLSPYLSILFLILMIFIAGIIGFANAVGTFKQKNDELNEEGVQKIKYFIEKNSKPEDAILSPPFYAVVTNRKIIEEYSELFLWTIKYWNEVIVSKKPGLGVEKVEKISQALREKKIPLAIIELDQTGRIPEIKKAIEENYTAILEQPFQTLNTRLLILIPKN